jgi:hypothetical protein
MVARMAANSAQILTFGIFLGEEVDGVERGEG